MKRIYFFLGKGGVGKSTLSISLAHYLWKKGEKVYLASIDPAHNLYDILNLPPFKGEKEVKPYFWIEEVDIDAYLKRILFEIEEKMRHLYAYLQIINLEKIFDLIKDTPGMEETATLFALKDIIKKHQEKDYIIIDTPPTGLMLKIFSLPFISKLWLEKLSKWRERILERRKIIAHVKGKDFLGKETTILPEEDKVLYELNFQKKMISFLIQLLTDKEKSYFILVINPDELSLKEGKRIINTLNRFNIFVNLVILNKAGLTEKKEINFFKNLPKKEVSFLKNLKDILNLTWDDI